jgi:hypothetical protein
MSNKPKEPPPKRDSLEKLAEFTKRILRVPKSGLPDKRISTGSSAKIRSKRFLAG